MSEISKIAKSDMCLSSIILQDIPTDGHKWPSANVIQIENGCNNRHREEEIFSLYVREIAQNTKDHDGHNMLILRAVLGDLPCLMILNDSLSFGNINNISHLLYTVSMSENKGDSMFGNGGGITSLPISVVGDKAVNIVGCKTDDGTFTYLMIKRQNYNFPRADITDIIGEKINAIIGDQLYKYNNIFIIFLAQLIGQDPLKNDKLRSMLSPSHVSHMVRLMSDELLKSLNFRIIKNDILTETNNLSSSDVKKGMINVLSNEDRYRTNVAESFSIEKQGIEVNITTKTTPCRALIDVKIDYHMIPCFQAEYSSGNLHVELDGERRFTDKENYTLYVTSKHIGDTQSEGISGRFRYQPIYSEYMGGVAVSRKLGLADFSYNRHLDTSQAIKVIDYMENNGVNANYDILRQKVKAANPYVVVCIDITIRRVYSDMASCEKPDFFNQANIVGDINNAFYISQPSSIRSLLDSLLPHLRDMVTPEMVDKMINYFQAEETKGIEIPIDTIMGKNTNDIIMVDYNATNVNHGTIVPMKPYNLKDLINQTHSTLIKIYDNKLHKYYNHSEVSDTTKNVIKGKGNFGTGFSIAPMPNDDTKEIFILSVKSLKKIIEQ